MNKIVRFFTSTDVDTARERRAMKLVVGSVVVFAICSWITALAVAPS